MNCGFICCSSSHTFSAFNSVEITRSLLALSSSSNALFSPYELTNSLYLLAFSPYQLPKITLSVITLPRLNPRQKKSLEGVYIAKNCQIFILRKTTQYFAGISKIQTFSRVCYLLRRVGHCSQLIRPNRKNNKVKKYTHTLSSSNCPHTKNVTPITTP